MNQHALIRFLSVSNVLDVLLEWEPKSVEAKKKKYTSLPFPTTLAEPSLFITTAFVTIVLLLVSLGWDISGMVGISSCATGIRVMMVGWAAVSSWSSGVWSRSGVASMLSVWHCRTSTMNGLCFPPTEWILWGYTCVRSWLIPLERYRCGKKCVKEVIPANHNKHRSFIKVCIALMVKLP